MRVVLYAHSVNIYNTFALESFAKGNVLHFTFMSLSDGETLLLWDKIRIVYIQVFFDFNFASSLLDS